MCIVEWNRGRTWDQTVPLYSVARSWSSWVPNCHFSFSKKSACLLFTRMWKTHCSLQVASHFLTSPNLISPPRLALPVCHPLLAMVGSFHSIQMCKRRGKSCLNMRGHCLQLVLVHIITSISHFTRTRDVEESTMFKCCFRASCIQVDWIDW